MTSKEGVLRNYTLQRIDRFSIDFCAGCKVCQLLRGQDGTRDDLEIMEMLHVDFRYSKPKWID